MADARLCVFLFVILIKYQIIFGKPLFGMLWCDLLCEDQDDPNTGPDYDDLCDSCPTRRPPTAGPPLINMRLPPTNGMNLSMANTNGQWSFNLDGMSNGMPGSGGTTQAPTAAPTEAPTQAPTEAPTEDPTQDPTQDPPMPSMAPRFGIWNGTRDGSIIPVYTADSFPGFRGGK